MLLGAGLALAGGCEWDLGPQAPGRSCRQSCCVVPSSGQTGTRLSWTLTMCLPKLEFWETMKKLNVTKIGWLGVPAPAHCPPGPRSRVAWSLCGDVHPGG